MGEVVDAVFDTLEAMGAHGVAVGVAELVDRVGLSEGDVYMALRFWDDLGVARWRQRVGVVSLAIDRCWREVEGVG